MNDNTVMPFGQHKGKKLGKVPANYLLWLADQARIMGFWPDLRKYIEENREALETEAEE